jgi:hypothetical protein
MVTIVDKEGDEAAGAAPVAKAYPLSGACLDTGAVPSNNSSTKRSSGVRSAL